MNFSRGVQNAVIADLHGFSKRSPFWDVGLSDSSFAFDLFSSISFCSSLLFFECSFAIESLSRIILDAISFSTLIFVKDDVKIEISSLDFFRGCSLFA